MAALTAHLLGDRRAHSSCGALLRVSHGSPGNNGFQPFRNLILSGSLLAARMESQQQQPASAGRHSRRPSPNRKGRSFRVLKALGPGLITGASDDDPSGIGTYSQAGAQLGFGIGWTMLLTFPLMVAIQEISARRPHHRPRHRRQCAPSLFARGCSSSS